MENEHCSGFCQVRVEGLTVERGGEKIIDSVSFDIHCGELTALIGINGAGKTTLLKAILGEYRHGGTVTHTDHDGGSVGKIVVGYVPQFLDFDRSSPVSAGDFLLAGRTRFPVCFTRHGKVRLELTKQAEELGISDLLDRPLGRLSGGELQRVMLASALYPAPQLLILDEPVSGVDESATDAFYNLICELKNKRHIAVAMVSHDLKQVRRYADRVVLLNRRMLCTGTPEEVFSSEEYKKEFGIVGADNGNSI
ncbi:MAG: metal ABC transporter ATP-binding protein [Clostridia bacterium]|nr:metal ABC transporter ATP-binding protein [Clostridia bacterium]